ncbi:MAG TPA: TIGR00300 family protein, partial [Ktedonobacterales bacterium]|nr:TIGR00300 family protein [Ktedonobacterales bacterium]
MASTEIELRGHIIDSFILPRVWGAIEEAGAHFHVREMRIGQSETETSYARIEVSAESQQMLDDLIPELQRLGADLAEVQNARTALVTQPGVLPDDFYSTSNLPTEVRVDGEWLPVANIEMDVAIVI